MSRTICGVAAPLPIANLDTDQIMPKQFLRGIDKAGLAQGVLYDLRIDGDGRPRGDFVLNRPGFEETAILVAGPNFGCGSSREHAVWGLQQFGIRAVIAAGYGEIFYGNALNNRLLPVVVAPDAAQALLDHLVADPQPQRLAIDVAAKVVHAPTGNLPFDLPGRYHRMFLDGLDVIGATLQHRSAIEEFATRHWATRPWMRDVAAKTRSRLDRAASGAGGPVS